MIAYLVCSHHGAGEGEANVRRMLAGTQYAVYRGRPDSQSDNRRIASDMADNPSDNLVLLDVDDGYFGLVQKRGAMLADALERFPDAEWLAKIDTDVVIWPGNMERMAEEATQQGAAFIGRHPNWHNTYGGACMVYSREAAQWVADCTAGKVKGLSPEDVRFKRESRNIMGQAGAPIMYAEDYHATTCMEANPSMNQRMLDDNRISAWAWRGFLRGRRVRPDVACVYELPPADQVRVWEMGPGAACEALNASCGLHHVCKGCYGYEPPQDREQGAGRDESPMSIQCGAKEGGMLTVPLTAGGCPMGYF